MSEEPVADRYEAWLRAQIAACEREIAALQPHRGKPLPTLAMAAHVTRREALVDSLNAYLLTRGGAA